MKLLFQTAVPAVLIFCFAIAGRSDDSVQTVRTVRQVAVYPAPDRKHKTIARINYGAVLKVIATDIKRGCKHGWVRLENGGYICSRALKNTTDPPAPAPDDLPGATDSFDRYIVLKGGAVSYKNRKSFSYRLNPLFLYRNTVLSVKRIQKSGDSRYLVTRDGHYVKADNVKKMNPVFKIGLSGESLNNNFYGFIIDDRVSVFEKPDISSTAVRTFDKYTVLKGSGFSVSNGWIKLPDGGYVSDSSVARMRRHKPGVKLEPDEKWIAVDLEQQLVTAYQGEIPVLIVPCSTGIKDNTEPGHYRIKWKRRLQTLNLYRGHLRVDDVPWVMYYIPERGFALHTAWHSNFGHKASHGCVNLPRDDAKWLYEWVSPVSLPFHSENLSSHHEKGTRVIVF